MDEIQKVREEFAEFKGGVKSWMDSTKEFRTLLCGKLETIFSEIKDTNKQVGELKTKIDTLPCPARAEISKGIQGQIDRLWAAFVVVVVGGIILGFWIKAVAG